MFLLFSQSPELSLWSTVLFCSRHFITIMTRLWAVSHCLYFEPWLTWFARVEIILHLCHEISCTHILQPFERIYFSIYIGAAWMLLFSFYIFSTHLVLDTDKARFIWKLRNIPFYILKYSLYQIIVEFSRKKFAFGATSV